jgi:thiol:disulfide interchange protein
MCKPHPKLLSWFLAITLVSGIAGWLSSGSPLHGQDLTMGAMPAPGEQIPMKAAFVVSPSGTDGTLRVTAEILDGWNTYAVDQPEGGPTPLSISLAEGFSGAKLAGPFVPDIDAHIVQEEVWDVASHKHEGTVTWTAPIRFDGSADPKTLVIPVEARGIVCTVGGSCVPFAHDLEARVTTNANDMVFEVEPEGAHAILRGWVDRTRTQPGEQALLSIEIEPEDGWLVGAWSREPSPHWQPTLVVLTRTNGATLGGAAVSVPPETLDRGGVQIEAHDERVTWTFPIRLPSEIAEGPGTFNGMVGFGTFPAESSEGESVLVGARFEFELEVGSATVMGKNGLSFSIPDSANYAGVATIAQREYEESLASAGPFSGYPVAGILGLAFLAGLILNVMPCVLPVLGIKLVSILQQGGENRRRILALNLVFALGILSVFMLFATFASFPQWVVGKWIGFEDSFGWGSLFESQGFVITMVAIVFAFGLSFLGVWEIPIPGFVAAAGAGKAAQREGYTGAFLKGVLTTLLATPCSGPLIIPAVTWATVQPPALTYLVFLFIGLGLASPFILIGIRPSLVAWLPKPGAWMETFKQLMGFALIGAAVFFLTSVTDKYRTPVLTLLLFIGIAAWLAGRITFLDSLVVRLRKWATAVATVIVGAGVAFYVLIPQYELAWGDFSRAAVEKELAAGNIVFVDFTAEWCFNCKTNKRVALNVRSTYKFFEENGVVALKGDKDKTPEVDEVLRELGNKATAIPYYAVYAPGLQRPIHFGGVSVLTPTQVRDAVQQAIDASRVATAESEGRTSLAESANRAPAASTASPSPSGPL